MRSIGFSLSSPRKLVYVVLGVLFLMLGLIGLIIPVIPGILFLFGAVFVLSKVSRRVRRFSQKNAMYQSMSSRVERMNRISVKDRAKVAGLMVAGGIAKSLDLAVTQANRMFARAAR